MSDAPRSQLDDATSSKTKAMDQARIRRERREAKIRAGGTSRLNKITGNGGGVGRDIDPTTLSKSFPRSNEAENPGHFDQTENFQSRSEKIKTSPVEPTMLNEAALHQMIHDLNSMNKFFPDASNVLSASLKENALTGDMVPPEDPIINMFQKMMGSVPLDISTDRTRTTDFLSHETKAAVSQRAHLWRFIHAVNAIAFSLYVALLTEFTGTKYERERSSLGYNCVGGQLLFSPNSENYFNLFIATEIVLLSSRYFLDREDAQPGGVMSLLMGFLQEPFKKYVHIFMRYMNICTTVCRDGMICIFVLGSFSWWNGRLGV